LKTEKFLIETARENKLTILSWRKIFAQV